MTDQGPEQLLKHVATQAAGLEACAPSSATEAERSALLDKLANLREALASLAEKVRQMPVAIS